MGTCNGKLDIQRKNQYKFLLSNNDYNKMPIVALEQAVVPLIPLLPTIQTYVRMAKEKCLNPADGLTSDESASIMLYTMSWQPSKECLYVVLNSTLRSINHQKLEPWFLYLKLLFKAILHLPSIPLTVYRDSQVDLIKQYKKDEIFFWWDLSLCRTKRANKNGIGTRFIIESNTVKDIQNHTYCPLDNSVLILPGTQFRVIECVNQEIILLEIHSSCLLQNQNKLTNLSKKLWTNRKESKRLSTSHKSSISTGNYRNVSIEQLIAASSRGWTVDLDEQNLIDRDMKTVVKHAIIKNHCRRIRLRDNHITSHGALILATSLNNNTTLESLDLRNNSISDLGVRYLSLTIMYSNLKTLNLESNDITFEGAQYLAQMLKNNRTLTELYLSKNHLGDKGIEFLTNALIDENKKHLDHDTNRGVYSNNSSNLQHLYLGQNDITDVGIEYISNMLKTNRMLTWLWLSGNEISSHGVDLLSDTLANHNLTLEWLFLNSNKSINDLCIDSIINMFKRNHSLKTMYINNCNLSNIGKQKLQEITKIQKDLDLEV